MEGCSLRVIAAAICEAALALIAAMQLFEFAGVRISSLAAFKNPKLNLSEIDKASLTFRKTIVTLTIKSLSFCHIGGH